MLGRHVPMCVLDRVAATTVCRDWASNLRECSRICGRLGSSSGRQVAVPKKWVERRLAIS